MMVAGGKSRRIGVDKALITINNKPLITRTFEKVRSLSEDILIITKTEKRRKNIRQFIKDPARFLLDENPTIESPLIGALTGIKNALYELILLIGCDMPFINPKVITLLYDQIMGEKSGYNAVIPRFPNGYIEPLCAIYRKDPTVKALERAIAEQCFEMRKFIEFIPRTYFLPVSEIEQIDPKLSTFFNVNTRDDLEELVNLLEDGESI